MTIQELLKKYDLGETSLKEEEQIRIYFQSNEIDPDLNVYKQYFTFFEIYKHESINIPIVEPTFSYWKFGAVAAILIIFFSYYLIGTAEKSYHTNYGESKIVILPDDSEVILNGNSTLIVHDTFQNTERNVSLVGEAFFSVTADAKRPFIVRMKNSKVNVLGTKFNIKSRNNMSRLFVEEGHVFFSSNESGEHIYKGQMSQYKNENISKPITISAEIDLAWKFQKLIFRNKKMSEVLSELKIMYNKTIISNDSSIRKLKITATFTKLDFESIIESICISLNLQVVKRNDLYILFLKPKKTD